MHACVIFNPVAKGNRARKFRAHLDALRVSAELRPTQGPGGARPLAAQALRDGFDTLIAAGGDGTVNEVINGMADVPEGFARARLGILPLGTVNVFARELEIPFALESAWRLVEAGKEARLDLPYAEFESEGKKQRRYFAQLGGAGLDARSIELVNWRLKKLLGPLAYILAGVRAICENQPRITVTLNGRNYEGSLLLIGNGRCYGGNLTLFPGADLKDGQLDLTLFPEVNWRVLFRWCWDVMAHGWEGAGGTMHLQGTTFKVTADRRTGFELEGDWVGALPATFGLLPKMLRVVC